jgi:hypothetical protein
LRKILAGSLSVILFGCRSVQLKYSTSICAEVAREVLITNDFSLSDVVRIALRMMNVSGKRLSKEIDV